MTNITYHPKQVVPRRDQLAILHKIAHQLGYITRLGDPRRARYEDKLEQIIGKRSLKGATRAERNTVVRALEAELAELDMRTLHVPEYVSDEDALAVLG